MKTKSIRILFAEDNQDHADLTIDTLNESGFVSDITHVKDGQECLDYLNNKGKYSNIDENPLPQLILMDIRMPKMDGIEALKPIKSDERLKRIPVVMLTTSKKEEEVVQSYEYGANSYVTKPVDFAEFSQKIKDLQLYWVSISELS